MTCRVAWRLSTHLSLAQSHLACGRCTLARSSGWATASSWASSHLHNSGGRTCKSFGRPCLGARKQSVYRGCAEPVPSQCRVQQGCFAEQ